MVKYFLVLILIAVFAFSQAQIAEAKVLPQAQKGAQKSNIQVKSTTVSGIGVFPKLRADRRALNISFTNLQNASLVSYLLTYKTSTQDEGAMGSINLGSSSTSQELLFGTCSKNVCRYHTGIKNAKLEISYTNKSGKKYLKKFKIKV